MVKYWVHSSPKIWSGKQGCIETFYSTKSAFKVPESYKYSKCMFDVTQVIIEEEERS